ALGLVRRESERSPPSAKFVPAPRSASPRILWVDSTGVRASTSQLGRYTRRLRPMGNGERINLFRALAIGERVGNAGPDLFRSPMKRCSHARFSRRESYGTRAARCLENKVYRNHTRRSSGANREGVRL